MGINTPRSIPVAWQNEKGFKRAQLRLTLVEHLVPGFGNFIVGKQALDLGCGSPLSTEVESDSDMDDTMYEPWLMRALATQYGADCIGVDFYKGDPADKIYYKHHKADFLPMLLANHLSIPKLGTKPVGFINTSNTLGNLGRTMYGLIESKTTLSRAQESLVAIAGDILTKGGVLFLEHQLYVKQPEALVLVHSF